MMNLEERRAYWNKRENRAPYLAHHDLCDSLPYPFEPSIAMIFDNKDVLEIGPGNGRQYERVRERTRSYSVCDISMSALEEPIFRDIDQRHGGRYVISDWNANLPRSFDVIHFWYVLHHIQLSEMHLFFAFVRNHLRRPYGLVAFNTPMLENVQSDPAGDGIGTTYSDPEVVRQTAHPLEIIMAQPVQQKSTGHVFLLRYNR